MTTAWTDDDVRRIDISRAAIIPPITHVNRAGLWESRIYWDMWPVQDQNGIPVKIAGREYWMALSAPDRGDPAKRHFEAKIRWLERRENGWADLGDVLPDFTIAYEREWAGSAVTDGNRISLYFTAAGTSARPGGYQQQLYETHGSLNEGGLPLIWSAPHPSITGASSYYMSADAHEGEAGRIKAFRDPAYFRDPADGGEYLIFTGSLAGAQSDYNGAVGIARKEEEGWQLLPPLIHADGVNNELERAHIVFYDGLYYAFWATQGSTFAPELRHAPNGLYGMVADNLLGEYRPLNGCGLVLRNPLDEPMQSYSWCVTGDLQVSSFVDFWGLKGAELPADRDRANHYFGGVPAPLLRLKLSGERCTLDEPVYA